MKSAKVEKIDQNAMERCPRYRYTSLHVVKLSWILTIYSIKYCMRMFGTQQYVCRNMQNEKKNPYFSNHELPHLLGSLLQFF